MTKQELLNKLTITEKQYKELYEVQLNFQKGNLVLKNDVEFYKKEAATILNTLNDVEEKNRALNSQIIELKRSLKTMSQFL